MHVLSVPPELQWSVCSPSSFPPPFSNFGSVSSLKARLIDLALLRSLV